MPKTDPNFYINWVIWAATRALQLSGSVTFPQFVSDVKHVGELLSNTLDNIPFSKPFPLLLWAVGNPDPLRPAREMMRAVKTKWTQ